MAMLGIVGTIDAIAVELTGRDIVQIAVPDVFGAFGQGDTLDLPAALAVEQAELDLLGVGRKQGKIRSASVPG